MLHDLSISRKISLLVTLMAAALLAVILVGAAGITRIIDTAVQEAQAMLLGEQRHKLSLLVETMATSLGDSIRAGEGEDQRTAIIRSALSSVRFESDRSGYFFVYDFSGVNIVHPLRRDFEGTNRLQVTDPNGKPYIRELLEGAKQGGEFVQYTFEKPNQGPVPKLALSKPIPGTNYWLATGLYIDNIEQEKQVLAGKMRAVSWRLAGYSLATALALLGLVVVPLSRRIAGSITKPLEQTTQAATAIAGGDYTVSLAVSGGPEQRILAQAFNRMTARVRAGKEELEALVASRTLELKDKVAQLESANERIMESTHYARTIQQALLPHKSSLASRLPDYFVIWNPKDVIGGDLFWFEGTRDSYLLAVLDCTGHGVPGALMTMLASTTLSRVVSEVGPNDPALILGRLNTYIRQILSLHAEDTVSDDGLDIGVCLVEPDIRRVTFAGARISLLAFSRDAAREIKGDRSSIGYKTSRDDYQFRNKTLDIEPDMSLYMLTDGLSDQIGGDRNLPLGMTRLKAALAGVQDLPMAEQKARIMAFFEAYKGGQDQRDDVTLLGLRLA